jgi:hypothetical protein
LLQRLEQGLSDDHELKRILKEVRSDNGNPKLNEDDFQQIFERIQLIQQNSGKKNAAIHDIAFNRKTTFALLEKEISRSARYGTDLSGIAISILRRVSQNAASENSSVPLEVTLAVLLEIQRHLRSADWMGTLQKDLFIAVLPMTSAKEAHLTARRLLKRINSKPMGGSVPEPSAKIAGAVIHYDKQHIPNADAFVRRACSEHAEMIQRLSNLQEFM